MRVIAAGGWGIANWDKMAQIAASWVISPVLGGVIAALFLYLIKRTITYKKDMLTAAKSMGACFGRANGLGIFNLLDP